MSLVRCIFYSNQFAGIGLNQVLHLKTGSVNRFGVEGMPELKACQHVE